MCEDFDNCFNQLKSKLYDKEGEGWICLSAFDEE